MEIILLEKIERLGNVGDSVRVKNGFARNFLLPQKKALRATEENRAYFDAQRAEIEKEQAVKRGHAEKVAKAVEKKFFVLLCQAGEDGRLYGSISARDVAVVVAHAHKDVERKHVALSAPIKSIGVYAVKLVLHPEVVVVVHVNVARTEAEAKEAEKEFLNPTKKEVKAEAVEAFPAEEGDEKPVGKKGKKAKKVAKEETGAEVVEAAEKEEEKKPAAKKKAAKAPAEAKKKKIAKK